MNNELKITYAGHQNEDMCSKLHQHNLVPCNQNINKLNQLIIYTNEYD